MTITIHMMADALEDAEIVSLPISTACPFESLALIDDRSIFCADESLGYGLDYENTLFVGSAVDCEKLSMHHPEARMLCIAETGCDDRSQADLRTMPGFSNCAIIRWNGGVLKAYENARRCLDASSKWMRDMQDCLLRDGSYQELLALSEVVIGNPMVMSDAAFRIVAYTPGLIPDEPFVREALENGRFGKAAMETFRARRRPRRWSESSDISILDPGTASRPYPVVNYVFRIQGQYYLHLVMHCRFRSLSEGLKDWFRMLIHCIEMRMRKETSATGLLSQGAPKLLADLAMGKADMRSDPQEAFGRAGFDITKRYAFCLFDFGYGPDDSELPGYAAFRIIEDFPEALVCLCSMMPAALIPLEDDEMKAMSDLKTRLGRCMESRDCRVGISDRLENLRDVHYAFSQANAALSLGLAIPKAAARLGLKPPDKALPLTFHECFAAYAVSQLRDENLLMHCLQKSVPVRLARIDMESGNADCELLFSYLQGECRTSAVSNELHLHRTTLLYRIGRIEKMFGIDLSDAVTRNRIRAEYQLLQTFDLGFAS